MFKKLIRKLGFTQTESKVILFLVIIFLIGAGAKSIFKPKKNTEAKEFDYSKEDSVFALSEKDPDAFESDKELKDKNIDYKPEVLDFNRQNFEGNKPKVEPAQKSININSADLDELLTLPGIGEKTAQSILSYRKEKGNFKNIKDLLEIKGIGDSKLNKIKKYLYIQ